MDNLNPTEKSILKKAKKIAEEEGIHFVYLGNIDEEENTICPKCKEIVIRRKGFEVIENKLKGGKCRCGEKIPGVWK